MKQVLLSSWMDNHHSPHHSPLLRNMPQYAAVAQREFLLTPKSIALSRSHYATNYSHLIKDINSAAERSCLAAYNSLFCYCFPVSIYLTVDPSGREGADVGLGCTFNSTGDQVILTCPKIWTKGAVLIYAQAEPSYAIPLRIII